VGKDSDGEVTNTEKKNAHATKNTRFRNNKNFSLLVKVLELFLRYPILVLAFKQEL
jgi:hypothetical protein